MKNNRRILITLIVILALALIAILGYLWTRPEETAETIDPTSTTAAATSEPRSASTAAPTDPGPTPAATGSEEQLVVGSPVNATDITALARAFDEEQAMAHIAYLASDELGGRQPGAPGGWAAGNYIAEQFTEYGLIPAGLNGSYYQTFTLPYGRITEPPLLEIIPPTGESPGRAYDYRTDYRALTGGYVGAGAGEGPVVWLNECLHDDYGGLDVTGQILLCRHTGDAEVYRQAIEHQVGGLLLLDREHEAGEHFLRGGYRETAWVPETIPAYLISEEVGRDLLVGTDYTLDELSLHFDATPLSTTVHMAVTVEEREEVEARNVLGLLPGADPEHGDEVVIIGAHYDHLGREPDGAVMNGANDNASGVATVMEIARLWQAGAGTEARPYDAVATDRRGDPSVVALPVGTPFRPARSVLFAAWDGEEQGLLGSRHYVEHATWPLTQTVAMLNLDMVGAGETLQIGGRAGRYGEGLVAAQLESAAETYGITHTLTTGGRSDHTPFYESGVPAAMLIWWPDAFYHTPQDEVEAIEPHKLKAVGVLSAHTLVALAEGEIELERAVARMERSLATGDREAFMELLDPTGPELQAAQAVWFDRLWSRELSNMTLEPGQMRFGDGEAVVALKLAYRRSVETPRVGPISYEARFVARDGGRGRSWRFAGYDLVELSDGAITVAHFPDPLIDTQVLLSTTAEVATHFRSALQLDPAETRVVYYPDAETMRVLGQSFPPPSQGGAGGGWSTHTAEIVHGEPITPALVDLTLNQIGLPPGEGGWLRAGLTSKNASERKYLPLLSTTAVLTPLLDFPEPGNLTDQRLRAYAWSATDYLLQQYGAEGLRDLCAAWGESGDAEAAYERALGLSPRQFESAWRREQLAPLRQAAEGIRVTIDERTAAVHAGDEAAFLSTVTAADPVLRAEERYWFADLIASSSYTYSAAGRLVGWTPGADSGAESSATVTLNARTAISGGPSSNVAYEARFVREGERWRYAGLVWKELKGEHITLKYQGHEESWARRVLNLAEAAQERVGADLETALPPQQIKLYDEDELFRALTAPSLSDETSSWAQPGASLKLWSREGTERFIQSGIARELTRQALLSRGVEAGWLLEGVAAFEADRLRPLGNHWGSGERQPVVRDAVVNHQALSFDELRMVLFAQLADDELALARAQSWSLVNYVVEREGLVGLRRLIDQAAASGDPAAGLGLESATFWDGWERHVRTGGVPDELVALARRFDAEHALEHIDVLAGPTFGGRAAGTPGAERAANYIAEQFALGLEPLGDRLTDTRSYLQRFPISETHLIALPAFALLDDAGTASQEFAYRDDFVELAGAGAVEGELVWTSAEDSAAQELEGLHFDGAVVLVQEVSDPIARAAELQSRGAGGLIVASKTFPKAAQWSSWTKYNCSQSPSFQQSRSCSFREGDLIPIIEISEDAFERLLERVGVTPQDLTSAPPALPLGAQAQLAVPRTPLTTRLTANVLGLWPGSDPVLGDEVIVIGAHYDHIGYTPDGLYFPGANQNGSGVAAMLEMARVWQSAGYRPARSVLFVAWGAEERDSAGVRHYLSDPAVPISRTAAVIALDTIADGEGYRLLFYGDGEEDLPLIHRLDLGTTQLGRDGWRRGSIEGWHALFGAEDMPTAKLRWAEAEKMLYRLDDTAAAIDPERLANSGEIVTLVIAWLAGVY